MKKATVGEVQKNFAAIIRKIYQGDEITITKRGKPIAKLTGLGPKENVEWPDFYGELVELKGKPLSEIVVEQREDRF